MRTEIRFAGVGGQGNILAGEWVALAAHEMGMHALQSPTYTAQVRGGPTSVDVLISDREIVYPRLTSIDFFLCLAQGAWDVFARQLKPDAVIVLDPNLVHKVGNGTQKVHAIPIVQVTKESVGKPVYTSAVVLGVFCRLTNAIPKEEMLRIIVENAPHGTVELNLKAFHAGWHAAEGNQPVARDEIASKFVESI